MPACPMMIESRRLTASATMPVGISATKTVASIAEPTTTSWNGSRPTVCSR